MTEAHDGRTTWLTELAGIHDAIAANARGDAGQAQRHVALVALASKTRGTLSACAANAAVDVSAGRDTHDCVVGNVRVSPLTGRIGDIWV